MKEQDAVYLITQIQWYSKTGEDEVEELKTGAGTEMNEMMMMMMKEEAISKSTLISMF